MGAVKIKRIETVAVDTDAARAVLAQMIRDARKQLGMNQERLALLVGISRGQIANLETGRSWVSIEQFIKLVFVLDLKISKSTFR